MKNTSKAAPLFSRGGLGVLAILVSLRSLAMSVTPAMLPGIPPLGILVGIVVLDILVFLVNLVSLCLHVVIVRRSGLVSLICLGLGLGSACP